MHRTRRLAGGASRLIQINFFCHGSVIEKATLAAQPDTAGAWTLELEKL
ncbi:hypothetical protein [Bradyrhizobium iriomotense]|nr:hypothetical protein [Bradyrhizobium iriomotense]